MTIYNLGSINIDKVYRTPSLPLPGETLSAYEVQTGMGGKGANMSVAAARAGAQVRHIGAVGRDGAWVVDRLMEYGVDTRSIRDADDVTGHAIITVADDGENQIVIWPGANVAISDAHIEDVLSDAGPADIFVTQNETNGQATAARIAKSHGCVIVYAAAPFSISAVKAVLPDLDILVLNQVEADQLCAALETDLIDLPVSDVVVTLGSEGCRYYSGGEVLTYPSFPATVIDTTGAGDTFTGFFLAGLDRGLAMPEAITLGQQAASLMVGRLGTADVIPDLKDVQDAGF